MTLLYYSPHFLEHKTGSHPERPARLVEVMKHLDAADWTGKCERPFWGPVSAERLGRVHCPKYAHEVELFAREGGGHIEADTAMSSRRTTWRCWRPVPRATRCSGW